METAVASFLSSPGVETGSKVLRIARTNGWLNLALLISRYISHLFPASPVILDHQFQSAYVLGAGSLVQETVTELLGYRGLDEEQSNKYVKLQTQLSTNQYEDYDKKLVQWVSAGRGRPQLPMVTLTVTTCKRLDLFTRTMNSFLKCCTDHHLISRWICVDDNSSEEDRNKMKELYPFFEFRFKTPEEKGHPQSMNIIREMVRTPYLFHMEDDWSFTVPGEYINNCLEVVTASQEIRQCLINKNYTETKDQNILGGIFSRTLSGLRYYIHEYASNDEEKKVWTERHGSNGNHCHYWPHFSFRPSLIEVNALHELGPFNETVSHFEMEYSHRYAARGWKSAFLEGVYSRHIGRLTSERNDTSKLNAYALNGEAQFRGKEKQVSERTTVAKTAPEAEAPPKTLSLLGYVINLDRRPDRLKAISEQMSKELKVLSFLRFPAVDGTRLVSTPQLQRIFDGNDYNMRRGMVGCAMSHIRICIEFLKTENDCLCVLEDDVELANDFEKRLIHLLGVLSRTDWDLAYLGHHLRKEFETPDVRDPNLLPTVEKWSRTTSLYKSLGGTGGYLITRKGAKGLLEFISKRGMTNGIDTVQQKAADTLNVYYTTPHLIYAECCTGGNNDPDTDIQRDYSSLTVPVAQRIREEVANFPPGDIMEVTDPDYLKNATSNCYFQSNDPALINRLHRDINHPSYLLEDKVIFVVPSGTPERYYDRLKKSGEYNVDDALVYKSEES